MEKQLMIPRACEGVKCMIKGCRNLAAHKVGEENIWCNMDYTGNDEQQKHAEFNQSHGLTTYLCEEHFIHLMTREEEYNTIPDDRFKDRTDNLENPTFKKRDRLICIQDTGKDLSGNKLRYDLEIGSEYTAAFDSFIDDGIEYVELVYNHAGEPCCQYKVSMFKKAE